MPPIQFTDRERDALDYAKTALAMSQRYIEGLPPGYSVGQRSGPNERELHAACVVALRLMRETGLR